MKEAARFEVVRYDRDVSRLELCEGDLPSVEAQASLALFGVGPVAREATVGQDRPHITLVVDLRALCCEG